MTASTILAICFWVAWSFVVYTYVLFPLALAVCARLFGRTPQCDDLNETDADQTLPRIVMVVAAFNEEKCIAQKLENTWKIDYPADKLQLYVGSDGSSDTTPEILRSCTDPRLRAYLFDDRRGKISVLNELMERVDADIVVMSDANTMYEPDAILRLVRHFRDPKMGCVSGQLHIAEQGGVSGEGIYWRYEQWIKRNESSLGFVIGSNGAVFAIRKSLFEPLPPNTLIEDFVLTMRVVQRRFRVAFDPTASVSEPATASSRAEMVRKIRIGAGGFQAIGLTRATLHPRFGLIAFAYWGHKVMRWLVPIFLIAALSANVGLLHSPVYAGLLAAQVAAIGLSFTVYRKSAAWRFPRWTKPISYFYLMNYALLLGLLRYVFGRQRVTWDRAAQHAPTTLQPIVRASLDASGAIAPARETSATHVSGQ